MREQRNKRQMRSKLFDLGDRQRRLKLSTRPMHFMRDGQLRTIDRRIQRAGNYFAPTSVRNLLRMGPGPIYSYGKPGSQDWVTVRLLDAADVVPVVEDNTLVFYDILPDTDYIITPLDEGCATHLRLRSAKAPRAWRWKVTGNADMLDAITGRDAQWKVAEIESNLRGNVLSAEWSGRVVNARALRRGGDYNTDVTYPVLIDPTVNEVITVTGDDRDGVSTSVYTGYTTLVAGYVLSAIYAAGWRFQTVDIPQGATITSADFSIEVLYTMGTPNTTMYGYDVDDSATWSHPSVNPISVTPTTASASPSWTGTGVKTLSVTSIVQEIVDRAGWVANNDMSLMLRNNGGSNNNSYTLTDLSHATAQEGRLDIVYATAGAVGRSHGYVMG